MPEREREGGDYVEQIFVFRRRKKSPPLYSGGRHVLFYTRNLPLRCVSARKLVIHGACFLLATRGIRFLIISLVSKVLEVVCAGVPFFKLVERRRRASLHLYKSTLCWVGFRRCTC